MGLVPSHGLVQLVVLVTVEPSILDGWLPAAAYNFLHALHLPVDIRNVCALLASGFSALTAWATYMCVIPFHFWRDKFNMTGRFTTEMKDESAGLLAAAFLSTHSQPPVPTFLERSCTICKRCMNDLKGRSQLVSKKFEGGLKSCK